MLELGHRLANKEWKFYEVKPGKSSDKISAASGGEITNTISLENPT